MRRLSNVGITVSTASRHRSREIAVATFLTINQVSPVLLLERPAGPPSQGSSAQAPPARLESSARQPALQQQNYDVADFELGLVSAFFQQLTTHGAVYEDLVMLSSYAVIPAAKLVVSIIDALARHAGCCGLTRCQGDRSRTCMNSDQTAKRVALSIAPLVGLTAAGGASNGPKPTAELIKAHTLVAQTDKGGTAQRYAPTDLQRARRAAQGCLRHCQGKCRAQARVRSNKHARHQQTLCARRPAMKHLIFSAGAAALLVACASPPQRNDMLEQAGASVEALSSQPLAVQAAHDDLDRLAQALKDNPDTTVVSLKLGARVTAYISAPARPRLDADEP